jgi:hypothetical protein
VIDPVGIAFLHILSKSCVHCFAQLWKIRRSRFWPVD